MELYVSVKIMNYSSCVWHINRHDLCPIAYQSDCTGMSGEGQRDGEREREGKYLTLPRGGNFYCSPASISYRGAQKALSFVESWYSYGFGIMAQMLITVKHTHTHRYTHTYTYAHTRYPLGN